MPKITIKNNDGSVYDVIKVQEFINRIDDLLLKIDPDIDTSELESFKNLIISSKSYTHKDAWYLEELEDQVSKYINNENDLPF